MLVEYESKITTGYVSPKMFGLSTKSFFGSFEKLRLIATPLVVQVRFRLWSERQPVIRRWGYVDKLKLEGTLPRIPSGKGLPVPPYAPRLPFSEKKALFGQNDYIDILGNGDIHPVKLSYNIPSWLRGFRGNEYQMLIRKRKFFGHRLAASHPEAYKDMGKRLKYLYKALNWRRKNDYMTKSYAVLK